MKKVEITVSNKDVEIKSMCLGKVIQLMNFMGHTMFNRINEEYINFCINKSTAFRFGVGDFFIVFTNIKDKEDNPE